MEKKWRKKNVVSRKRALHALQNKKKKERRRCVRACVYSNAESNRGPFANSISLRFEREKDYLFFNVKRT